MTFDLNSFTSWYMCAQRRDVVVCTGPFPNVNAADKYFDSIRLEVHNSTLIPVNNLYPYFLSRIYLRYKYNKLFENDFMLSYPPRYFPQC